MSVHEQTGARARTPFARCRFASAAVAALLAPSVLAFASIGKVLAWDRFQVSLDSYTLLSEAIRSLALTLTPAVEMIPLVVLLARRPLLANILAATLLTLFTLVIVWHWTNNVRPSCGCLGLWADYTRIEETSRFAVVRNGALLMVSLGLVASGLRRTGWRSRSSREVTATPSRRAFTLVELLVVIVVVAILGALTAGLLSRARSEARRTISLSNLRTHGAAISSYTDDHAEIFPYFTTIGFGTATLSAAGLSLTVSYFDAHRTWHIALADSAYAGNPFSRSFVPPRYVDEADSRWPLYTPYLYGCAFIADARFWNPSTRTGPDQFAPTRVAQVLYPSAKVLVVESWPYARDEGKSSARLPAVLVDGSASPLRPGSWNNGYERGDGHAHIAEGAIHFADSPPLLHTIDGVHGRDLR